MWTAPRTPRMQSDNQVPPGPGNYNVSYGCTLEVRTQCFGKVLQTTALNRMHNSKPATRGFDPPRSTGKRLPRR